MRDRGAVSGSASAAGGPAASRGGAPARVRRVAVATTPPYDVHIGLGAMRRVPEVVRAAVGRPTGVLVVSDDVVAPLHAASLRRALAAADMPSELFVLPAGEGSKSVAVYGELLSGMAAARLDRSALVLALGGGVVGDLVGFAAATFLRGVRYLHLPTTLLAMVDSSVGGKTGINLAVGKNLVGAFWQPAAVVADVAALATLPERTLRHGAVELFKAGLLGDPIIVEAFGRGASFGAAVTPDDEGLLELIVRGVAVKAAVVAADPMEGGRRAILNLGHTVGHALESLSRHALPHGEALAYGLLAAAVIGAGRGLVDWRPQARQLLTWVAPRPVPEAPFGALLERVGRDKKRLGALRRFVLLEEIGRAVVIDDLDDEELRRAHDALLEVGR